MSTASTPLWLGLLFLFIVLNGLFVAAEYAILRLRKTRVEEMIQLEIRGARTIYALQNDMDRTVAGAQLGITVMGLAVGGIGQEPIRAILEAIASLVSVYVPISVHVPGAVALALSFVILTMLHVIIGEQVPKMISLRAPEAIALTLSLPFMLFCRATAPMLWFIGLVTSIVLRLPGMPRAQSGEKAPSVDELSILVENSAKAGTLGKSESHLVQRALEYRGLSVRDVMVPQSLMDCLSEDLSLADALEVITRTKHSRLPLFRGSRDVVVGVLRTRELLDLLRKKLRAELKGGAKGGVATLSGSEPIGKLTAYIRKPFFVLDTTPASVLLEDLRIKHLQLAVVIDAEKKVVGLITQEDLVEQLVGEIHDEDDGPIEGVESLGDGVYKVEGSLTLFEFRKVFDYRLSSEKGASTVEELFIELSAGEPKVGDRVEFSGFSFTVLSLKNSSNANEAGTLPEPTANTVRIEWLEVRQLPEPESYSPDNGDNKAS